MTQKARLWTGVTILCVLLFNYAVLGIPLINKSISIKHRADMILVNHVKAGKVVESSDEDYVLEIFHKEKRAIDKNILILSCISISFGILVASWTVFGLIAHRRK